MENIEKEIVNILSDADPTELNYMLPKIGLGLLFYKVKDHAPINLHRTRLLNLLADTRISVSHKTTNKVKYQPAASHDCRPVVHAYECRQTCGTTTENGLKTKPLLTTGSLSTSYFLVACVSCSLILHYIQLRDSRFRL